MAVTTTIAALVAQHWDRVLLDNLYPSLQFYQFADKKRIPAGTGKTAWWSRYIKYAAAGGITDGTAIGVSDLCAKRISAVVAGYGIAAMHSDFIIMTGISDVVRDSVQEVSKALALAIDNKIRGTISGSGTLLATSGKVAGTVLTGTPLQLASIITGVNTLDSVNCKRFPDGNYVAICHPGGLAQLRASTTANASWIDINKYANSETVGKIYRGEVGMLHGVRFIQSTACKVYGGNAALSAVHGLSGGATGANLYMFGAGAYGAVELDGGNAKTYVKQLGSAGTADPINQNATVGAKIYFGAVDLDCTNRLYRIAHGTTA